MLTILLAASLGVPAAGASRLDQIRARGIVTCGVGPGVPGFSEVDAQGRYSGFDIDICRALSAAIFGQPDRVRYVITPTIQAFLRSSDIDVISRRLTLTLTREGLGVLFGPIVFYDGQGFLVSKTIGAKRIADLAGATACVQAGSEHDDKLTSYMSVNKLAFRRVPVADLAQARNSLTAGRCQSLSDDVSALAGVRAALPAPDDFEILPELMTKEPLAQLVRNDDVQFFSILRWTIFALIEAEETGVNSTNVDQMLKSSNPRIQALLGVAGNTGSALGLDAKWARNIIKSLGHYGEIYERNIGARSRIKLARGLNRLWTEGGLIYAPPLQ
ncbi:MAG TPA: amino acid ABC transporter substrate-binding protein [Thermomicrobiales bacterium]|nr:amino acid ABC transporter substrate-binding protein [Thermomicrobiales bacterium]